MDVHAENRGRPHQEVLFFAGPNDGEKLFDPGSCPREIRTGRFISMLFFFLSAYSRVHAQLNEGGGPKMVGSVFSLR